MRWAWAVLSAVLLAGCATDPTHSKAESAIAACRAAPAVDHVLYFGPSLALQPALPPAGHAPGNSFSSAFVDNNLKEWLSAPFAEGGWLIGNVTLEFWVRSTGSPAPVVLGGGPGEGYHFFNQFGSDRTLQPAYGREYSRVAPASGTIDHYTEVLPLAEGGFVLEQGDRVRVILTDLALDGPDGGGHDVLFGGGTPSQVRFSMRCWPDVTWADHPVDQRTVLLPGNQGLLTGAVPPGQANQAKFAVTLPEFTDRLTITLRQTSDPNPVKDDVDITLLDRAGHAVWSIGSPYSDEAGTLWHDNLEAVFPDGDVTIQVDSYSGAAYQGEVTVTASTALAG